MKPIARKSQWLFALLLIGVAHAQNPEPPCLFVEFNKNLDKREMEKEIQHTLLSNSFLRSSHHVKTIPVVVHVIHNGGAENISDAQILSQIQALNEDFRKLPGTNGDGDGVDTGIQFCLASKNPDGKCTNGIVRVQSPLTMHQSSERDLLKQLSGWNPEKYLNIYVVRRIGSGGTAGYAAFPGGPPDADGVVVIHNAFGRIGTGAGGGNLGRTLVHEIGHWMGLFHVFQDSCGTDTCTTGDLICDTPPQAEPNYGCPTINSCSNDFPDVNDQVENYMDYSNDACKNMFTNGQKLRMQATLNAIRTNIWSPVNLIATGCDSAVVLPPCPVVADFTTLTPDICVGNAVQFHDRSLNDPTMWVWVFEGGTPEVSNDQNPAVVYDSVGTYAVTLVAQDSNSADVFTIQGFIEVSTPGTGRPLSFGENFESGSIQQGVTIHNPDNGVTWELDSNAAYEGRYSIRINNYINTNYGQLDEIVLPYFDFSSAHPDSSLSMRFYWAYARSDANFSDELFVYVSTDCGSNFDQVFYRSRNALATGPVQTTFFVPDSTQWKAANIDLSGYAGETYVLIRIVNVTDGGNNLYIDDIYVGDGTEAVFISGITQPEINPITGISLFPNPVAGVAHLSFSLSGSQLVQISTYDHLGRQALKVLSADLSSGEHRIPVETKQSPAGVYFIQIRTKDFFQTLKLVKTGN